MNSNDIKMPMPSAPPYSEGGTSSRHDVVIEEQPPPSYEATAAAPETLPPTYQSLYGEFQQVEDPKSLARFFGKVFTALINTVTAAVTIALLNVIPLFMIILGSVNLNKCPAQPLIPVWILVSGAALMLKSAINFVRMKVVQRRINRLGPSVQESEKSCKNPFKVVLTLLALFFIAWFILGSVWVYEAYGRVEYKKKTRSSERYCDKFTYVFSFVYATFVYIAVAVATCCCCCCCCCVCFRPRNRSRQSA